MRIPSSCVPQYSTCLMHPAIGADQRVHQVALKVKLKRNDIQNVLNNSYDSHQKPSLKN